MRIVALSDLDFRGSGYFNIITPLCEGLAGLGHEIKVAGLHYEGDEHWYNFSILPAATIEDGFMIIANLNQAWPFDVLIVALDLTLQESLLKKLQGRPFKYMGIFPVESDPVTFRFALVMQNMDKPFVISQFGEDEAKKAKVEKVEHLVIGMDRPPWRVPTEEERNTARKKLGLADSFVVFSVADNQERKNLAAAYEIISTVKEEVPNVKYTLITRPGFFAGWDLDELATRFGIQQNISIFRRGMDTERLWLLYASADAFLSTAKAEGLNMPVLEAMACGIPVVAGDHTALREHLSDGKGFLIPEEYTHIDPFANSWRYWIDKDLAAFTLIAIEDGDLDIYDREKALEYIAGKKWKNTIAQVDRVLREWENEKSGRPDATS